MSGQLRSVQALRAIAALFVVVFHSTVLWHDKFDVTSQPWENGNAGVDLFFVISGFIMVLSSRRLVGLADGWKRFLTLRLIRIIPMYWLVTAAKLAAIAAFPALAIHTHPTLFNVFASFLFVPSRDALGTIRPILDVGWTLSFELLFYAAFACALFLRTGARAVVIPMMAALAVTSLFVRSQWPAITSLADPIVLEFVFGLLIGEAIVRRRLVLGRFAGFCLLAAAVIILAIIPTDGRWARVVIWGASATLALYASVATERWSRQLIPDFVVQVGEASYSLYLTHAFVLPLAGLIVIRTRLPGSSQEAFLLATCLAGSIAVSLAVFRFVELPITVWLRRKFTSPTRSG